MSEEAKRASRRRRATTRAGRRRSLRVPGDDVPREQNARAQESTDSTFDAFDDEDAPDRDMLADDLEGDVDVDVEDAADPGDADDDDRRITQRMEAVSVDDEEAAENEKTIPRIDVSELKTEGDSGDDAVTDPHIELGSMGGDGDAPVVRAAPAVVIAPAQIISDAPAAPSQPTAHDTIDVDIAEADGAADAPASGATGDEVDEERVPTEVGLQSPDADAREAAAHAAQAEAALPSVIIDPSISNPPPEPTPEPAPAPPEPVHPAPEQPAPPAPDAGVTVEERVPKDDRPSDERATLVDEPVGRAVLDVVEEAEELEELVDVEDAEGEVEGLHSRSRTPPPPPPEVRAKAAPPPPPPGKEKEAKARRKRARQWWERFFSEDYLLSVLPPTDAQVARQVDFIEASLGLADGATVLDVGCGLGLHALELTRRGHLVVGLDLSLTMITRAAEAAQQSNLKINFLHADIREIEFEGTFDAVICMGTTFGFFDDEANVDVLSRLHQALKPGGRILLDVVNRDYVISSQPNLVWFEGDECVCMEESDFNYFNSRLVVKRTMMREDGQQSQADYSIRLYALHELGQLMQTNGFRVLEVSGQEATRGMFFGAESSRILMLAERRVPGRASVAMAPERPSTEVAKPPPKEPPLKE